MSGLRKFGVVVLALTYGFILAMLGKLDAAYASIVTVCVGAFHLVHGFEARRTPGTTP